MNEKRANGVAVVSTLALALLCAPAVGQEGTPSAQDEHAFKPQKSYSPYAGRNFPTRVFCGDTHLHTGASMDAGAFGARLGPEEAFRFARGEEITAVERHARQARRGRSTSSWSPTTPTTSGFFPKLFAGDPEFLADPTGKRWYEMIQQGGAEAVKVAMRGHRQLLQGHVPAGARLAAGHRPPTGRPGRRTSGRRDQQRARPLHRLHRLRVDLEHRRQQPAPRRRLPRRRRQGGPGRAVHHVRPVGSDDPKDLWKVLQAYEDKTGGNVLAIAHNGNLSNGIMFPEIDSFTGKPLTQGVRGDARAVGAALRGDADQGRRRGASLPVAQRRVRRLRDLGQVQPQHERAEGEGHAPVRVRPHRARRLGLQLEAKLGTNPYKFGMIGSTDSHTGLATADEDNFFGKHAGAEPNPQAHGAPGRLLRQELHPGLVAGGVRLRGGVGDARTRARRSSTPWSARRPTRPPARA